MLKLYEQYDSKTLYPLQEKQCYLKSKTQPWTNVLQMFVFLFFVFYLKFEFNFSAINRIMPVFRYVTRSCFCNCALCVLGQHCFPCHCLWEVPHAPSLTHNPPMKPKRRTKNKRMNKIAHHLMSTYSSQLNKHSFVFLKM